MSDISEKYEVERQRAEDERDADERESVEQLLSGLGSGYQVSLSRIKPSWCKGWLETIEADTSTPVDMAYIADNWGGDVIRVRVLNPRGEYSGGRDVTIAKPPREHGRPLKHPEDRRLELEARANAIPAPPPAPPQPDYTSLITNLINALNSSNQQNLQVLLETLKAERSTGPMGIGDMVGFAEGLRKLGDMFSQNTNEDAGIAATFTELLKAFNERQQRPKLRQRPKQLPRQTPAQPITPIPTPQPMPQAAAQPPAAPNPFEEPELSLSEELAEMAPEEVALTLGDMFEMYSPQDRERLLALMGGAALGKAVQNIEEEEEENQKEKGEGDEPDEPSEPPERLTLAGER